MDKNYFLHLTWPKWMVRWSPIFKHPKSIPGSLGPVDMMIIRRILGAFPFIFNQSHMGLETCHDLSGSNAIIHWAEIRQIWRWFPNFGEDGSPNLGIVPHLFPISIVYPDVSITQAGSERVRPGAAKEPRLLQYFAGQVWAPRHVRRRRRMCAWMSIVDACLI